MFRQMRALILSVGLGDGNEFVQPEAEINAGEKISVIVAIHDAPEVLERCLRSLEKNGSRCEVILVNDGSKLQMTKDLINQFSCRNSWSVIQHETAKGHSRSCEAGAAVASRQYFCFLNSDTILTPWSWEGCCDAFDADPRIGIVGPSTSRSATAQVVPRAEHCRQYWNDSQVDAFAHKYTSSHRKRCWTELPEIGGFAFFVRRQLWDELRGFDLNLPDYGNEFEFCRRASKQGWRLVWVANSYIHHLGEQSYQTLGLLQGLWAHDYIVKKHRLAVPKIQNPR
jgi:GT2 family glycosyltransferase